MNGASQVKSHSSNADHNIKNQFFNFHKHKSNHMKKFFLFFASAAMLSTAFAQDIKNNPNSNHANRFEQLGTILPTPNEYRTASGAPGPKYWQQRCDYDIKGTLDEKNLKFTGTETITYFNNSPDVLTYLWLQLDENEHSTVNNANYQNSNALPRQVTTQQIENLSNAKRIMVMDTSLQDWWMQLAKP